MKKKAAGARVVLSFIWHFEMYIYIYIYYSIYIYYIILYYIYGSGVVPGVLKTDGF